MADDPDALWKPGADGEASFDRRDRRPFVFPATPDRTGASGDRSSRSASAEPDGRVGGRDGAGPDDGPDSGGSRGPVAALAIVGAVVVVAAVVAVLGGAQSDQSTAPSSIPVPFPTPVPSAFPVRDSGGDVPIDDAEPSAVVAPLVCTGERLPTSADERWAVSIDDVWNLSGPLAAGSGGVAALTVDTPEPDASFTLRMFESVDGSQRWRIPVDDIGSGRGVVGVVAGIVIVEGTAPDDAETRVLTGFDVDTGFLAWTQTVLPATAYLIDPISESIVVDDPGGGDPAGVGSVTVLDASDGGFATSNVGRFVALDADRRLVTLAGGKFLFATDAVFRSGLIGVTTVDDPPATPFGTGVLIADGEPGALRLIDNGPDGAQLERSVGLVGSERIDAPSGITSLTALDDDMVVVTGRGAVHGAVLDETGLRVRWRVDGVLSVTAPSDRGATLLVFSEGGALQRLVDAATGRKFLDAESIGGALDADDLFTNGVVVGEGTGSAAVRTAYDLDGEQMWQLPRRGSLAVGDRVVYDTTRSVGTATEPPSVSLSIVAHGPVPDGPSSCEPGADVGDA